MVIKPVFITRMFVRAEREAYWPLHLKAVELMMRKFFAAGHIHYGRYGLYYLRQMQSLPTDVLQHFMTGEQVMRHRPGIYREWHLE